MKNRGVIECEYPLQDCLRQFINSAGEIELQVLSQCTIDGVTTEWWMPVPLVKELARTSRRVMHASVEVEDITNAD